MPRPLTKALIPADTILTFGHLLACIEEHEAFVREVMAKNPQKNLADEASIRRIAGEDLDQTPDYTAAIALGEATTNARRWMVTRLLATAELNDGKAPDETNGLLPRDLEFEVAINQCGERRREAEKLLPHFRSSKGGENSAPGQEAVAAANTAIIEAVARQILSEGKTKWRNLAAKTRERLQELYSKNAWAPNTIRKRLKLMKPK